MIIDIEKLWYSKNILSIFLLPLSWLFQLVSFLRRSFYKLFHTNAAIEDVCIIVVGNITVGGTGKTPFVSYLAQLSKEKDLKVGVVARGYGRTDEYVLIEVLDDSDAVEVGDEALMLKQQISCPIVVAADRNKAVKCLNDKYDLDVIISDDGLQHYNLARDYEIIVVDGEREFGNGRCLPAGPLREPVSRLNQADIVISNGENSAYEYQYTVIHNNLVYLINSSEHKALVEFANTEVHAVAGIGNPKRFFAMLENVGINVIPHIFPDHYAYKQSDLEFNDKLPIIMTEKDAVKCSRFNKDNTWYLPIKVMPNDKLEKRISKLLEEIS